jgi:NAD(P)-dependent dehydrogenase (short-subunit alcohol dehydrogenase family)
MDRRPAVRLSDKVVVVTGAGRGIGAAMATRFAAEGVKGVVVSDVDGENAERTAAAIVEHGGHAVAVRADVTDAAQVAGLVTTAESRFGPVDLFCSNAGIATGQNADAPAEVWAATWAVNVMAHVHAVNAVLPGMIERGGGYLLHTVSAAGLLTCPGDAPYTATKHAAIGFAEWVAMTYGAAGIKVSALCPLGVKTDMLMPGIAAGSPSALAVAASGELLEPETVADAVVKGIEAESFLILPHPEVAQLHARKAADPDAWLGGVRHAFSARNETPDTVTG